MKTVDSSGKKTEVPPRQRILDAARELFYSRGIRAVSVDEVPGRIPPAKSVNAIAGTPAYMAPEMVDFGRKEISTSTDVYLLGAILQECRAQA